MREWRGIGNGLQMLNLNTLNITQINTASVVSRLLQNRHNFTRNHDRIIQDYIQHQSIMPHKAVWASAVKRSASDYLRI